MVGPRAWGRGIDPKGLRFCRNHCPLRLPVRLNRCRFYCGFMVRDARKRAPHHEVPRYHRGDLILRSPLLRASRRMKPTRWKVTRIECDAAEKNQMEKAR